MVANVRSEVMLCLADRSYCLKKAVMSLVLISALFALVLGCGDATSPGLVQECLLPGKHKLGRAN